MHIIFFTYDTIIPTDSGGKTRAFNLIKHAKKDAKISLFSFTREGYDLANLDEIKKIGVENIELFPRVDKKSFRGLKSLFFAKKSIFYNLYYDAKVAQVLRDFVQKQKVDLVHFESFYTGFYISEDLRMLGIKQVYGSENIEHLLYKDSLKSLNPVFRKLASPQVGKIREEEAEMARLSDSTLAVTANEREYFLKYSENVSVVSNGIDPNSFQERSYANREKTNLLFVGNFSYFPNIDGIKFFIENVWSKLDKNAVSLTVLGRGVENLHFLPKQNVERIEYIDNINDAYINADIFISPLRQGGGTNFKVLEAMASGLPVVALRDKVVGINAKNNENILIAEDGNDFTECIEKLLKNPDLRKRIGSNAREYVRKNYSWKEIGENLYKIWYDLVNEKN